MSEDYKVSIPERYRVTYSKVDGSFHILDTWHDDVKNIDIDAEIPLDSLALKVISSLEINALLGKLKEMDWLSKFTSTEQTVTKIPLKTLIEIAIENIEKISSGTAQAVGADESVAKEAIAAIREVMKG
jgi:hypothetical protein